MQPKPWWQSNTQWALLITLLLTVLDKFVARWPELVTWLTNPEAATWFANAGALVSILWAMWGRKKASQPTTTPLSIVKP